MRFSKDNYTDLIAYVQTILEMNKNMNDRQCEILITPAGYDDEIDVEVNQYNTKYTEQDHFMLVRSEQELMQEYHLPDNHYEYFHNDEEYNEYLADWLAQEKEEGREWIKSNYGFNSWHLKGEVE